MRDSRAGTMSSPHGGGVVTAAVALVAFVAITTAPTSVVAVPTGTTEYSTVQIANQEWDPETSFGNSQANLQLGVESNKANTFQDIGFGYVGNALQYKPPAVIAYEQTSSDGETKGDLVFGTRSSTSGSASATQQLRVRSDGTVEVDGNLQVDSTAVFNEQVNMFYGVGIGEYLEVSGTQTVTGAADFGSTVRIRGDAIFDSKITVTGTFTALGDYKIGDHAPSDSLTVNAATTHNGRGGPSFTQNTTVLF